MLEVKNLHTYFKTDQGIAKAVDDISFKVEKGEVFAIVGESGCGKSMTALSIMGLVPRPGGYHPKGSVQFQGKELIGRPESFLRTQRGNNLAMIFQEPMTSLNPVLKVGYQIMEPLLLHQKLNKNEAKEKAIAMLASVQILEPELRFEQYPFELSGGMKQRVMIAMAMACEPELLIADEPTTALDVTTQAEILQLMRKLQNNKGTAVLMITHDLGVVNEMTDRVGVMYAGRLVEVGSKKQIIEHPVHPYTVKLLDALPSNKTKNHRLETISGRVPPAYNYPTHCRFANRCHISVEECKSVDPFLKKVDDYEVACHRYETEDFKVVYDRAIEKKYSVESNESNQNNEIALELKDVKVHFPVRSAAFWAAPKYVKAVDGVSFKIEKAKTLALVGESGCGKSTLAKAILDLGVPLQGDVLIDNIKVSNMNKAERHKMRKKIQIIFQDPYSALDSRMMVGEIIAEGMVAHKIGRSVAEKKEKIEELLNLVGLDKSMVSRYPHEFSGGQRQRIGIARALALEPEVIICDEATSALDVSVQAQIINLLKDLQSRMGLTYLFITHDLSLVEYLADQVVVMQAGKIVEEGLADDIFGNPKQEYTRTLLDAAPKVS